jgi:hypothetical protein
MRYVPNRQAPEVAEVHYVDEEDSLLGGSPREIWGVRGAGRPTRRPGMPRQVGMTGLIKAIDRFEVSREVRSPASPESMPGTRWRCYADSSVTSADDEAGP